MTGGSVQRATAVRKRRRRVGGVGWGGLRFERGREKKSRKQKKNNERLGGQPNLPSQRNVRTIDLQLRGEVRDSRRVRGDASVLPSVLGPHGIDGQEDGLVPERDGCDSQGCRLNVTSVKVPLDFERLVTLRDVAVRLDALARIHRAIELERSNIRRHWNIPNTEKRYRTYRGFWRNGGKNTLSTHF